MIKRKRKRNPLKDNKKLLRKIAEFLARAIEKEPDGITAYLLAAELVRRDSLYCEECRSFDIKEDCDWSECYPEIYELEEDSTLDMAKEAAEELAEDLGIVDYVNVFRYSIQRIKYEEIKDLRFRPFMDLKKSNLVETDLSGLYLSRADLSGADLSKADLCGVDLSEAKLPGANLSGANLSRADLSWADLSWADLSGANLSRADLSWADLSWADLSGANFTGANLYKANFTNVKITHYTCFKHAINMDEAINLVINNPGKISKTNKISLKCAASGKNFTYAKKESNKKNSKKKRKLTD